jgi:YbbR domain-containing protein
MKSLLDNFWLKIMALVLGLLLWLHVATEKTYNHEVRLKVAEILLDDSLTLANTPPESLTIVVSATGKQLLRQRWRNAGVRINASQYQTGRHTISLSPSNTSLVASGNRVAVDGVVSPSTVTLAVDRIAESRADVDLDLIVEPDDGFAVSYLSDPVPPEVTVRGARSLVRTITMISTEHREVSGVRTDITLTLAVIPPEGYGISVRPDSVEVNIEVVPVKTRVFQNIPIVVYNIPAGEQVSIQPQVINVELNGPPEDIDLLNRNAIVASVDYRNMDTTGRAPVKVDVPSSFRVKRQTSETVRFTHR